MANFLSESELNSVKGLLHYLNEHLNPGNSVPLSFDASVVDANGEKAGTITFNADVGEYVLGLS